MPGVLVVPRSVVVVVVVVVVVIVVVRGESRFVDVMHRHECSEYTPMGYTRHMTTRGYTMQKDDYLRRLRRIEGQIRGLQRMVADDEYCIDVLTQVSAATKALQSVAVGLLDEHLRHCVAGAARSGGDNDEADRLIDEATDAINRLVKS